MWPQTLSQSWPFESVTRWTHALAPSGGWNKIVDEFLATVKAGRLADGVLAAIAACGAVLKTHHPASSAS